MIQFVRNNDPFVRKNDPLVRKNGLFVRNNDPLVRTNDLVRNPLWCGGLYLQLPAGAVRKRIIIFFSTSKKLLSVDW